MDWEQATKHFSSNYDKAKSYYSFLATTALKDEDRYYFLWMAARAVRLSGLPYDKYKMVYLRVFEDHPDRIEALCELAEHAPPHDRVKLLKKSIYVSHPGEKRWVDQELYEWKALRNYVLAASEVDQTHESYDAWQLLMRRETKIPKKLRGECRADGKSSRSKIFADRDSYDIFREELREIPKLMIGDIPNIVHIMWILGHRTYSMIQYLTVVAANNVQHPIKICIYNDVEPVNNEWWNKTKAISNVEIVRVTPPRFVNKNKIPWAQHIADLMRVQIMYHLGGIYLDADLFLTKELSPLLKSGVLTMVQETEDKLWNGFLAAPPGNPFFERWIREYETKYGTEEGGCWWAGLSVETPMRLYRADPTGLSPIETYTLLPFGIHDNALYHPWHEGMYEESYGIHLWETEAEKRGVLPKDMEYFKLYPDTGFSRIFGQYAE